MTKHLEELEEISKLKLGIILLIKELDKHKELKQICLYLRDLVEGIDENTIKQRKENMKKLFDILGDKENENIKQ